MVRLKLAIPLYDSNAKEEFQSHNGSIKTLKAIFCLD